MKTALFVNFSTEAFIGYWNGKPKKFEAGQSVYMPDYLARHFAKHLTNRELLKRGLERDTSPKVKVRPNGEEYVDNQNFLEVFNQAYIPDSDDEFSSEKDSIDVQIEVANKNRKERGNASLPATPAEVKAVRPEMIEKSEEKQDPTQPQVIVSPDFDDDVDDDSFPNESTTS